MAGLTKNRRKKGGTTAQDFVLALSKSLGLDLTQEYDSESFAQLWVDLYQSQDPDSYPAQGEYLYNLLAQLQGALLGQQDTTAVVQAERKTKVWFQSNPQVNDLTDPEIVDLILSLNSELLFQPILDSDQTNLLFVSAAFND